MSFVTKAAALLRAQTIRQETGGSANTAARLGSLFYDLIQSFGIGAVDVSSYGADPGFDAATNQAAIQSAVTACVASGASLWWPVGTYQTSGSIANLHSVRHRGPGAIGRGSDVFYLDPRYNRSNTLYVATTGSSGNDGLTSLQPFTPNEIAAVLANYGPMLDGTWTVVHAAGTYSRTSQVTIDGLKSLNPIVLRGPAVAYAAPITIYDGTGSLNGVCGIYARNGVRLTVRDMKFQNFASTDAMGVTADRHCELLVDNVHTTGNDLAGVNAESHTRLYVTGGIHSANNYYNLRAYGQCLVTIGYSSSAHRVTIGDALHAGGSGILVRDNSSGHIDYCDINGVHDGGGVELINQSRVHFVSNVFGGSSANYYNVKLGAQCTYIDDGTNTFNAATAKSIVQFGFSIDSSSAQRAFYDPSTGFFRWGRTDSLTPKCLFDIQDTATALWGGSYNSNVLFGVDGSANSYIGLGAANNGECGIMFADVAGNRQGQLAYLHTSDSLLARVNAIDAFRWFSDGAAGGYYRSEVTGANAASLGDGTHGWRALFLGTGGIAIKVSVGTGAPGGVVTGSPGDIYINQSGGAGTTLYVKESGSATTAGWVGK